VLLNTRIVCTLVVGLFVLDSPVIARLSYDIVKRDQQVDSADHSVDLGGERYDWEPIITPAGASGWVPRKYARSNTGPTFVFERTARGWKMISFVIGTDSLYQPTSVAGALYLRRCWPGAMPRTRLKALANANSLS
jgi:hypothetical protein